MQYRKLGDLEVSPICLGAWMFGGQTPETVAARIVDSARDAGVNFVDTADVYANGESERIIGRHLRCDRHRWVLATKVGEVGPDSTGGGLGRSWVMKAIDASLARLGTDHVDIYYLHLLDPSTPIEETLQTLGAIIAQGKVRHFGVSNYRGWQIADMVRLCDQLGVPRPIVCQPYYNILNRTAETEILPACSHFGIGTAVYSPLAGGLLTGKYGPSERARNDDRAARRDTKFSEDEFHRGAIDLASRVAAHAKARGMAATEFAIAWILANASVTSAIAGPRTEAQWGQYLDALQHTIDDDDETFVSGLIPAGQPSVPGFADPWHRLPERERTPGATRQ